MKWFLQEYFYYSRAERNGAFILALLCVGLALLPRLYPYFIRQPALSFEEYQEELAAFWGEAGNGEEPAAEPGAALFYFDPNTLSRDSFLLLGLPAKTVNTILKYREKAGPFFEVEGLRKIYTLSDEDYQRLAPYVRIGEPSKAAAGAAGRENREPAAAALMPFPFDPNTAGEAELSRLGLPAKLVRNILKYREKGGRFREPESLRRIYGMEDHTYRQLAPFIEISEAPQPLAQAVKQTEGHPQSFEYVPAPMAIDINQAAEEEWQQIKGIGPAYARRITSFRDKLGGFATISQVGETYGLPDSVFRQIQPLLRLSPVLRKLNVNSADAEELKTHPYLDWRQANAIVNYRANHGPFQGVDALKQVKALPTEVVDKLAPYLEFE